ncbi:MAG: sugar phosphate isomerase/epimerase family protein [Oscillospiraceae bacterium]|nr:sugar phosphate isomerase/epimerase family protein [Oscillospiraceae bacterium]
MELCFNEMTVMKNGTLPEDIALCAQAGFSAVELRKGTLLRYLRGGGTLEALWQTLEEQHVRAASLNALESVSFQTKAGGRMLRELSEWCFAACRVLGCGCMEVIASFNVPEGISTAAICRETADSLLRLSDAAADYGVRLALEFMAMPGSSVQTFAQCAEILEAVDRANVGMLLDTWHFCAGGSQPEELSALRGDRLFMVHVSD